MFSSPTLPVTIVQLKDAEVIYRNLLGTEIMVVPNGPEERLNQWPGLELAKEVNFMGIDNEESSADVTLSSAGM